MSIGGIIMKERKKYTNIDNKYLAMALSFLGLRFYKFTDDAGRLVYSFEKNSKFDLALHKLLMLKEEFKAN